MDVEIKKVLLISYFFPPVNLVGSSRSGKMAKYLPHFGWQPWVLTAVPSPAVHQTMPVEIPDEFVIRTNYFRPKIRKSPAKVMATKAGKDFGSRGSKEKIYRFFEKISKLSFSRMPDRALGWYPYAVKTGVSLLKRLEFDAIYSIHGPPTSHLVASRLYSASGIPWIADYRDFWSLNPYDTQGPLWQKGEEAFERRVVKGASTLVVVNHPMASKLNELTGKPVVTIRNGFDEDDFVDLNHFKSNSDAPFSMLYPGSLYPGFHDLRPLFQAVRKLHRQSFINSRNFVIRFLGTDPEYPRKLAAKLEISSYLEFLPFASFKESLAYQSQATVLILFKWEDENEKGVCPSKFYEYLGARRPVLSIGKVRNVTDEILEDCHAGLTASTSEETSEILREWIAAYRENGEIGWEYNLNNLKKYSRKAAAEKMADLLNEITE